MTNWMTPTTYADRFTEAVTLLCGQRPPADLVAAWLDKDADDHRLQDFAASHGPVWSQGIGLLDAAHLMASQPTEGVDHEPAPEPALGMHGELVAESLSVAEQLQACLPSSAAAEALLIDAEDTIRKLCGVITSAPAPTGGEHQGAQGS